MEPLYPFQNIFVQVNWIEAVCNVLDVKPQEITIGTSQSSQISATIYRQSRRPFKMYSAYDSFSFKPTSTSQLYRIQRQWHDAADKFSEQLVVNDVFHWVFPPTVNDVRPFLWKGWDATPHYTFIHLLHRDFDFSHAVRKNIKKAERHGYTCERDDDLTGVLECIYDTEHRQGVRILPEYFDKFMLEGLFKRLGPDCLRIYNCRDKNGDICSSRIVLWDGVTFAQDWVAGTKNEHLQNGSTQLTVAYMLEDLKKAGCCGFDFCGADVRSIQQYKSEFGGLLLIYFSIRRKRTISEKLASSSYSLVKKLRKIWNFSNSL